MASQPTLSRFENGVGVKELYRMGEALAVSVMRRHGKRLRHRAYRVTIELDPTDDPTHGAQQLSFFNGHYEKGAICRCWALSVSMRQPNSTHEPNPNNLFPRRQQKAGTVSALLH
ncbi:MAG: transposase [Candidatus Acidiferrum sp.]